MKLTFSLTVLQQIFGWNNEFNIRNEFGEIVYVVKCDTTFRWLLKFYDAKGNYLGMVKEYALSFKDKWHIEKSKAEGVIAPTTESRVEYKGWKFTRPVEGNYSILDSSGCNIAVVSRNRRKWTDTVELDVENEDEILDVLMWVIMDFVVPEHSVALQHFY